MEDINHTSMCGGCDEKQRIVIVVSGGRVVGAFTDADISVHTYDLDCPGSIDLDTLKIGCELNNLREVEVVESETIVPPPDID